MVCSECSCAFVWWFNSWNRRSSFSLDNWPKWVAVVKEASRFLALYACLSKYRDGDALLSRGNAERSIERIQCHNSRTVTHELFSFWQCRLMCYLKSLRWCRGCRRSLEPPRLRLTCCVWIRADKACKKSTSCSRLRTAIIAGRKSRRCLVRVDTNWEGLRWKWIF